jgi:hypothetical protein
MTLHKMNDLFDAIVACGRRESIAHGAVILRGFALEMEQAIIDALRLVMMTSPFRHMTTPGGHTMSAAVTNCGAAGNHVHRPPQLGLAVLSNENWYYLIFIIQYNNLVKTGTLWLPG